MSLSKLFQRIIWHNNTTPAINEDNLNAMSKAIDDIDDRVILIGDDVVTVIPQIQAYLEQAESIVEAVEELSQNPPYIGSNGNWWVFDTTLEAYKDSGVDASITVDIADITMIAEGAQPYVTNTGTSTDPIFHLFLPRSPQGATGNGIANIAKTGTQGLVDTYTITMTDGTTTTFTVTNGRDGSGSGDMTKAVYDSINAVADAGGIADYVEGKVEPILNVLGAKNLLPNTVASQTINGVTFTVNADGSISCSGTSTAELWWNLSVQTPLDTTKEYILSGCPSGGDESSTYSLGASDGNTLWRFDEGSGVSFTPTGASNTYITIHIKNGINMTGKVFKPMLRLSSIADSTYVPYSMTNQQITPYALSQSNPNLLDNPWFTVNQRGLATAGATNSYFVDRWKTIRDDGTLTWNSSGITFATDLTGNSILLQSLEQGIDTSKQYTLSVMFSDGQIVSGIFNMASSPVLLGSKSGQAKIYTSYNSQYNAITVWFNDLTQAITIRAIKLELGTQSTLAHDTAPNYAQELLKCQRYYQRLENKGSDTFVGVGYCNTANFVRFKIPYIASMRVKPTLTLTGKLVVWGSGYGIDLTTLSISWSQNDTNGLSISIGDTTGTTSGSFYYLFLPSNSILEMSADL